MRPLLPAALLLLAGGCASLPATATTTAPTPVTTAASLDPRTPLTVAQRHWVDSTLASLSLRDRVGQMVMVWVLGDYTSTGDSSFVDIRRWITEDHVGGVNMSLGTPIEVAAKINSMQRMARVPLLVSSDLEPGLGRLEGGVFTHYLMDAGSATVFPSNMAIAATGRDEDAYDAARAIAQEGRAVGIHVDFAPVVDVNNNPNNPVINTRSFGEDPRRVARLAAGFVRGLRDGGELATAKHFPGHGDTDVDSHVGLPVVNATIARLDTLELVPFRAAIDAGAALVMTAHIALPAIDGDNTPATLSPRIITGLLRDSLHFQGTAITDAMTMEGVGKGYTTEQSSVLAVQAGADILLKPSEPRRAIDAVVAAVERGEISRARIDSAARHVLELKARAGVPLQPITDLEALRAVVGAPAHRALAADIAQRAITLLRDRDHLVASAGTTATESSSARGAGIAGNAGSAAAGAPLIVQYMPATELTAGRVFGSTLRDALPGVHVARIGPDVAPSRLDSLGAIARTASRVVVAAYVRRIEGSGGVVIPQPVAAWIDSLARERPVVVVAFGNPYLIRQFPSVGGYMVTYGVSDDLERAAARALLGEAPIGGHAPVSLPGFFQAGDGITATARAATSSSR